MNRLLNMNWGKVLKGAGIAMAGCGFTYFAEWARGVDFGAATPIVTAAFAVAVNFARKLKEGGE